MKKYLKNLALIIIAIIAINLNPMTVQAGMNGAGASNSSGYWRGGFSSNCSGSLVYLVDNDGYSTSNSTSYLFVTSGLRGLLSDMSTNNSVNEICPRVSGISKPVGNYTSPWGPSFGTNGNTVVSRVEEIGDWFNTASGTSTQGIEFVRKYWGDGAAEAFKNKEIKVAIELVCAVRMGYRTFRLDGGATTETVVKEDAIKKSPRMGFF